MSADLNYALSRQGAPKFQFDTHFFDRLVDYMHVQFCDILFSIFSHNLHELARVIYARSCKGQPNSNVTPKFSKKTILLVATKKCQPFQQGLC